MKTRLLVSEILLVCLLSGLTGCAAPNSPPAPTSVPTTVAEVVPAAKIVPLEEPLLADDPAVRVVLDYVQRVNEGDFAGAADLFDDEAMIYFVGMPPTGMEIYRGKDQYHTFLEECCAGQNFVMEVTPTAVENGIVSAEAKTWMDFTRQLGVAPNSFHEVFLVRDGRIARYGSSMTEAALANFKPAMREVIPELFEGLSPALTTDETPATEIAITISDGTCSYNGPMTLQAGQLPVTVEVADETAEKYAVSLFTLDAGKDLLDLMASTYNPGPPSWSKMLFLKELKPGASETYESLTIEAGLLYLVCWSSPPDLPIGNAGPFVVQK